MGGEGGGKALGAQKRRLFSFLLALIAASHSQTVTFQKQLCYSGAYTEEQRARKRERERGEREKRTRDSRVLAPHPVRKRDTDGFQRFGEERGGGLVMSSSCKLRDAIVHQCNGGDRKRVLNRGPTSSG